jgi:hypothetical protein
LSRRRKIALVAAIALLAGAIYGGYQGVSLARIATNYAAEQTCACLFVSGRSPESCQAELGRFASRFMTWRIEEPAVTVSLLRVFSARAEFEQGFGCHAAR